MTTKLYNITGMFKSLFRHIWLSVSSISFYHDVHKKYSGYGVIYLLNICLISVVIASLMLINSFEKLNNYLATDNVTSKTENIHYMLSQLPIINYDGHNINIDQPTPIHIKNLNQEIIAVLDPENKLSFQEKLNIPIILTKDTMLIRVLMNSIIDYKRLIGDKPLILNNRVIKDHLGAALSNNLKMISGVTILVAVFIYFAFTLFIQLPTSLLIYCLANFFGLKTSMQSSIRLSLFSAGAATLLYPIFIFTYPPLIIIAKSIYWTSTMLMILSLIKLKQTLS